LNFPDGGRITAPFENCLRHSERLGVGDPLLDLDPVFLSIPDQAARNRLVCKLDMTVTQPEWALGYRWDVVLRGRAATPVEGASGGSE